jgi:hypothetical protein
MTFQFIDRKAFAGETVLVNKRSVAALIAINDLFLGEITNKR